MLAEAADAGKSLYIYPVPAKPAGWRARIATWVLTTSRAAGPLGRLGRLGQLCGLVIDSGLVVPPRDLAVMHEGMIAASLRSEEHTSELQSLMRISYAVYCLKKKQITDSK